MKIMILVKRFPPKRIGGTELATLSIANHLSGKDHQVHVVTTYDEGTREADSKHKFSVHRIHFPGIRFLGVFIFSLNVLRLAYDLKPDLIHAQGVGMGFTALVIKKLLKIKYVIWGRGTDVFAEGKLKRIISKMELRGACAVISLTNKMQKKIKETYAVKNSYTIPNGIELDKFDFKNRKISREHLDIPEGIPLITFVGNLRRVKGVEYLIKAFQILLNSGRDCKLLIIGDGPERKDLISLVDTLGIQKNVIFTGSIPRENIMDYLRISDIFVLPSLSEGFPNVILEAMAAGLPIVTTNFEGSSEIVEDGVNGFIVQTKNPKALADSIAEILDDFNVKQSMSARNREAVAKYDWGNIIIHLEKIYDQCLGLNNSD